MASGLSSEDEAAEAAQNDPCAICGERLGLRSYRLRHSWEGRAHGPCKSFDEARRDAGYPDAPDPVTLKRMIRADEGRRS